MISYHVMCGEYSEGDQIQVMCGEYSEGDQLHVMCGEYSERDQLSRDVWRVFRA